MHGVRIFPQSDDRSAPTASIRWRVGEGLDEGMSGQDRADNRPLGACTAAVNDADLVKSTADGLREVLLDEVRDIPRREGVEVQGILDRQRDSAIRLR